MGLRIQETKKKTRQTFDERELAGNSTFTSEGDSQNVTTTLIMGLVSRETHAH